MEDSVLLNVVHLNGSSDSRVTTAIPPKIADSLAKSAELIDLLTSEFVDGRKAIATALTNRRYPTEPSESFHAMADKITNMSFEDSWFARIGYTDENASALKEMIDYSYDITKTWNPDGSTAQMFRGNKQLVFAPMVDTSKYTSLAYMFDACSSLTTIPQLDTSSVTNMGSMFYGCSALTTIPLLDTSKVTVMSNMFSNCSALSTIQLLDMSSVIYIISIFSGCAALRFIKITNLGKSTPTTYDFSSATNWGTGSEENRQSLIDSLITYSYDRASNGMATATIKLSANTKALLTEGEIAQITNKGFTIA